MQSGRQQDGAMNAEITGGCSINNCPRPAVAQEVGESAHWTFIVRYCQEHHREIEKGTPVGPVGIVVTRLEVHPKGADEPATTGIMPSIGPG
jgi:hypothetical protein